MVEINAANKMIKKTCINFLFCINVHWIINTLKKYNNANYKPIFIFLLNLLQSHQEHNPYKVSSFHEFVNVEPHQLKIIGNKIKIVIKFYKCHIFM